jgi:hypothetical protein
MLDCYFRQFVFIQDENRHEVPIMFAKRSIRLLSIVGLMIAIFASTFVFSLHAQEATPDAPAPINISMTEYKFLVEGQDEGTPLQLETGKEYTLHFTNSGNLEHEVLIGSAPIVIKDGYHHDFNNLLLADVETSISGQMNGDEFVIGAAGLNEFELKVGQEMSISFTLPEDKVGDWEMGCFVSLNPNATEEDPGAGHYDIGMHIPVKVIAGTGA